MHSRPTIQNLFKPTQTELSEKTNHLTIKSAAGSSLKTLERAKAIPAGLITGTPISHSKALDKYFLLYYITSK